MNNKEKDRTIKYIRTSDYPNNTLMTYDEIKNQLNSHYGFASSIDAIISEDTLKTGSLVDNRLLILSISDWGESVYFFDLRSYKIQVMPYKNFEEFIAVESINIKNIIDIRDRLFNNENYNNNIKQMSSDFKSMFDDRMKAVVEIVCEEAAKKFTENFIDDMLMIREREEDY